MVMEKRRNFLRYFAYSLEIVILFVISSTPHFLPEIFGSKPCLLLPLALAIAVFESETVAMSFGFVCGLLTDIGFSGKIGFYTVVLTLLCFAIGYCARNFFVTNLLNASIIGIASIALLILIHFWLNVSMADISDAGTYFIKHYISRMLYTGAFFVPLYFLGKLLCTALKNE
ncbi:MAG: rod shape-determining protein MreD [Clostridia bacterium]|nr:rod shape-determining protein MreD [Clostridia bacterium]